MPGQTVVKPWSTQQCVKSCAAQKNICMVKTVPSNPSPANAYKINQCYTNYNSCVKACTTNNIRPKR